MNVQGAIEIVDFKLACVYEAAKLENCNCWACEHNRQLNAALSVLSSVVEENAALKAERDKLAAKNEELGKVVHELVERLQMGRA